MLTHVRLLGVLALAVLAGGCGTYCNTVWFTPDQGGKQVYGGVRIDAEGVKQLATQRGEQDNALQQARKVAVVALDVPLSLVADTLTLPYILWVNWGAMLDYSEPGANRPAAGEQPASSAPDPGVITAATGRPAGDGQR